MEEVNECSTNLLNNKDLKIQCKDIVNQSTNKIVTPHSNINKLKLNWQFVECIAGIKNIDKSSSSIKKYRMRFKKHTAATKLMMVCFEEKIFEMITCTSSLRNIKYTIIIII